MNKTVSKRINNLKKKDPIEKTLVPPERIVAAMAKTNSKIARLIELFGENVAASIMLEFQGEIFYFPRASTLNRMVTVMYMREELKNLRKDSLDFRRRTRQLGHLFAIPERRILKIYKNGKYIS